MKKLIVLLTVILIASCEIPLDTVTYDVPVPSKWSLTLLDDEGLYVDEFAVDYYNAYPVGCEYSRVGSDVIESWQYYYHAEVIEYVMVDFTIDRRDLIP